eukprot:GHVL01040746.1.p1 GENE.GHVL01040746.1~~GHVL01040746.1.p1  ORF type:complete len:354 (-),score=101.93 GHVL01040746.1:194-1111(-)
MIYNRIYQHGWNINKNKILLQKSRSNCFLGNAIILTDIDIPNISDIFPYNTKSQYLDIIDVKKYIEQWERNIRLTDDIKRISNPIYINRIITISDIPITYGRIDIQNIINNFNISVNLNNIVFRFSKNGYQSSTCYVVCNSIKDADILLEKIQELPVPIRQQYSSLFGCQFLWSCRDTIFLCNEYLDTIPYRSKYHILSIGWDNEVTDNEFKILMNTLKLYPKNIIKLDINFHDNTTAFIMEFTHMDMTKTAMIRLHFLAKKWKIKKNKIIYAYVRGIDMRKMNIDKYEDDRSDADSDIDEPVEY